MFGGKSGGSGVIGRKRGGALALFEIYVGGEGTMV